MPSTWLINDVSPESLGLAVTGWDFQAGTASSVMLRRVSDFDAAEILSGYGGTVTIKRNGAVFFKGKIRAISKRADGQSEGQDYIVEDAWAEMERTIYQEPWKYAYYDEGLEAAAIGDFYMPRCFLGMNSAGVEISVGEQIQEAITYAASVGIDIQLGSVPDGMVLWPSEVNAASIAEVIRTSLRLNPDWIPWIDHTTTPPTFNVTPRASATALSIAATDCIGLESITELNDTLPEVVRIVFITASEIDGQIYRAYAVDKYPMLDAEDNPTPDAGPGVLCEVLDLQGVRSTSQVQQIQTRDLPTDNTSLRTYLKKKYPLLAEVDDAHYTLTNFAKSFVTPIPETLPDSINSETPRLEAESITDCPRELVRGTVTEAMRKKVGRVKLTWDLEITGAATEGNRKFLESFPKITVPVCTNATTRVHRSITSWTPAEDAPTGIAQAFYETIHNGAKFQGSIRLSTEAMTPPWHGKKLNITGGVAAWATMGAPIQSVSGDAQTEIATITFGPTPRYGFSDFVEYMNRLRRRQVTWISGTQRTSEETGVGPQSENVGPFDIAETTEFFPTTEATHPFKVTVIPSEMINIAAGTILGMYFTYSGANPYQHPSGADSHYEPDTVVMGPGGVWAGGTSGVISGTYYVYAEVPRNGPTNEYSEGMSESAYGVTTELFDDIEPTLTDTVSIVLDTAAPNAYTPTTGKAAVCIAKVTNSSGTITVDNQYVTSNPTLFVPVVGAFSDLSIPGT